VAKYCGTSDCLNWYEDFNALTGTDATTANSIITEASDWLRSSLDAAGCNAPVTYNGTYDYWVRYAAAQESIYMAIDRRKSGQYEDVAWWSGYHDRAQSVVERIAAGELSMQADVADHERGIGRAASIKHGTVGTTTVDMMFSNWTVQTAWYTSDIPRTFLVELDGQGSMVSQQTYRWKYRYGTKWEDTSVQCKWGWRGLADGVAVRFEDTGGTEYLENGQQWIIPCNPPDRVVNRGQGMRTYQMYRG